MKHRYLFIIMSLTAAALPVLAAQPHVKVRLEMWEGCLCGNPDHSRTYEQLKGERAKRMLFGKDVTIAPDDAKLAPRRFLEQHLDDSKLKVRLDFFWRGVVYRRGSDGQSYSVEYRGLRRLAMADFKDGDLIVYYQEFF